MSAADTQTTAPSPAPAPVAAPSPAPAVADGFNVINLIGDEPTGTKTSAPAPAPGPAAAPAPSADGRTEDGEGGPEEGQQRDGKGRFKVQERIDELTRARREAERDRDYWRARAGGAEPAQTQPPAQQAAARPARDKFQSQEAYEDAVADWRYDQRRTQEKTSENLNAQQTAWQATVQAGKADLPDFDTVVNGVETPVAMHLAELIMNHDSGPKLMYHLAKNPAEIERLNVLSPVKVANELAKIAVSLTSAPSPGPAPAPGPSAPPAVSAAPKPPSTVGAGRSTTPSLENMNMEDYIATRGKQGAKWAR